MAAPITLAYRPDGTKIRTVDLPDLLRLSNKKEPVFGWLNKLDEQSGRFVRRLSHRLIGVELSHDELIMELEPLPSDAGRLLRRLYDEYQPLRVNPFIRGATDVEGHWGWESASLIAWDVHLLPEQNSPLDRFMRAVDRPKLR